MKSQHELMVFFNQTAKHILIHSHGATKPLWGRMDLQQMIEHLTLPLKMANGKLIVPIATPADKIEKLKTVALLSSRPLPKGFQNVALPVDPLPYANSSKIEAINKLYDEFDDMLVYYSNPNHTPTSHNLFGVLTLHEWLWFHYKHFMHHLAQFNLVNQFDKLD